MQPFSLLEAALYNLLRSLPLIMLAFYPFRDKRRFSAAVTAFLQEMILLIWMAISLLNAYFAKSMALMAIVEIIGFVVIAALFVFSLHGHPGKMLFICFMIINVGYMMTVTSKCLEGYLFPDLVMDRYRWSASLCLGIVSPFILVPVFYFLKWEKNNLIEDILPNYVWEYSWLVPTTFYLVWVHNFYGSGSSLQWTQDVKNILFLGIVNFASFMVYYLMLRMIRDNANYVKLREENHLMTLQLTQYDGLNQRIALARQGRHDLRHHIVTLENMAKEGDLQGIRGYLAEIGQKYELEGALIYCSNMTVNGILTYFAEVAKNEDIEFKINIGLPEDIPITKTDLSVIFGNLLENAVEACQRQQTGRKKISLRGQTTQNTFALAVDNTYEIAPETDRRGRFRSMKHSGPGIGTESVRNIVDRYNGVIEFEPRGDLFCVSLMLYLQ